MTIPLGIYRHFKDAFLYTVTTIAIDATNGGNDGLPCVVYRSRATGETFARDLDQFVELVTWPDGVVRPRFDLVEKTETRDDLALSYQASERTALLDLVKVTKERDDARADVLKLRNVLADVREYVNMTAMDVDDETSCKSHFLREIDEVLQPEATPDPGTHPRRPFPMRPTGVGYATARAISMRLGEPAVEPNYLTGRILEREPAPEWTPPVEVPLVGVKRPIPTVLHCPSCGARHVDEGEWATTRHHRTHQCQECKREWRPWEWPTVGVGPDAETTALLRLEAEVTEGRWIWRDGAGVRAFKTQAWSRICEALDAVRRSRGQLPWSAQRKADGE